MRKRVITLCAIALCLPAFVAASGWLIVGSHAAPGPNARGIGCYAPFSDSILCDGSPPRIYNDRPPYNYITLDVPRGVWGLGSWGAQITVSNYNNSYIYDLTTTGSVISSFRCPKDGPADLSTWPFHKFVAIPDENLAIKLSGGSIVSSFRGPGSRLTALQAEGPNYFIGGDPSTHKVYFSGYGEISLPAPASIWADQKTGDGPPDPEHFYVVDSLTNYVYSIRWIGPEAVAPASLGRVKALFR